MGEIHAERRESRAPESPLDLQAAADGLLEEAQGLSSGRMARTLTPGEHGPLKQTLIALTSGTRLDEHDTNGPATIQILRGSVTINDGSGSLDVGSGQWARIPDERHDLEAHENTVMLITVAPPTS